MKLCLISNFRIPLLPGSCGGPLAGDKRATIGVYLMSRASSEAFPHVLFSGDELEAKFIHSAARCLGHADDVCLIMRRAIVKTSLRVINARASLIQKVRNIRTLAKKLSQHHLHGQHTAGKLTSIVDRCIVHWRYKPLILLRKPILSTCGPP